MPAPPSRALARRLVVGVVIAFICTFAPVPGFQIVPVAAASSAELSSHRPASDAELSDMRRSSDEPIGEERTVSASGATETFSTIGVSLASDPSGPMLVRAQGADGDWTEWTELHLSPDEGPDRSAPEFSAESSSQTTRVSEPLWVGPSMRYEVSLAAGDAHGAAATTVVERERRVAVDATPLAEASTPPPFGIHNRSSWGARAPSGTMGTAPRINFAVVHHTASTNSYTAAQVPAVLRSMQAYHMDTNGWSDIAYNFLIDRFGRTWEGRAGSIGGRVIGAHAMGFNTASVGVSLIGTYSSVNASPSMLEAASRVIGWKLSTDASLPSSHIQVTSNGSTSIPAGQVVNLPRVIGHRDVGATSCPGSPVYASLGSIRNRASQYYRDYERLRNPVGNLDSVVADGRRVVVRGWTKDPDVDASVVVHIELGGRWYVVTANGRRPDVAAVHPDFGSNRGFELRSAELPPGAHTACAYAINQGRGTGNPLLGCFGVLVK